ARPKPLGQSNRDIVVSRRCPHPPWRGWVAQGLPIQWSLGNLRAPVKYSLTSILTRLGTAAASSKLGGIVYHHDSPRLDTVLSPVTRARFSMGPPGNTVLITTTGAKSGKKRRASLAFLWDGDDMIIIASKGGAPHHPGWYHNLKADPRVTVQHRGGIEER